MIAVEALQRALSRDPKLVNPTVAVETLEWLHSMDPTFNVGESHTAKATLTNQTDQALTCTTELYLDVTKVATSGVSASFTLPAGGSIEVSYVVPMPASSGGPYHVYIDVWSGGTLLAHYQPTEDVTVVEPPPLDGGWTCSGVSAVVDGSCPVAPSWNILNYSCQITSKASVTATKTLLIQQRIYYTSVSAWSIAALYAGTNPLQITLAPGGVYNYQQQAVVGHGYQIQFRLIDEAGNVGGLTDWITLY